MVWEVPVERAHHAMAYDSDRRVTVFFGGEIGTRGDETYFNDTWEDHGNHWKRINIVGESPDPLDRCTSWPMIRKENGCCSMAVFSAKFMAHAKPGNTRVTGRPAHGRSWRSLTGILGMLAVA